jgi:hypothetical protein
MILKRDAPDIRSYTEFDGRIADTVPVLKMAGYPAI